MARIKRVFPADSYQDFRVFSRDAKVLVRRESSVSGGESARGRRSTDGRRERLDYSASVRNGGYIDRTRLLRMHSRGQAGVQLAQKSGGTPLLL